MRCHICNAALSPPEVQRNADFDDWEPCSRCLDAISEVFNDDDESDIDKQLEEEFPTEVEGPENDQDDTRN